MRWTQSQSDPLITLDDLKQHLRIDSTAEDNYLTGLIAAATSHAEISMQCSLLNRTITAMFYANEPLSLPRGPVQSVSSVSVSGSPVSSSVYSLERYGTLDVLRYQMGKVMPHPAPATLSVVYIAGYGATAADVPPEIIQVIKCHAGLMYEQREVATDRTITAVPFISEFYKLHSREPGVG